MRYQHGHREYYVTDGRIEHSLRSDEPLSQGMCLRLEGEMAAGGIIAKKVEALEGSKAAAVFGKVLENAAKAVQMPQEPVLLSDGVTQAMWAKLAGAATSILCAKKLGRSVLLRFHGDADGISGAFALTAVMPCKAFQQNSAIYSVRDALRDISMIGQESRPMVILLDFGSSDPCKEGMDLLGAAGIELMVVDHHIYSMKDDARIINPIAVDENASKYTAGYLACEIAAAAGLEHEKALMLARTACAGDKSDILKSGPDDAKRALVLDFLASHLSFGNNLDFYRKVVESDELYGSIASQADESIEEAAGKALARAKKSEPGGIRLAVFSLEGIAKRGEWPPSGKITTRIFDKLKAEKPGKALICIGYTDRSVIMRLNDEAAGMGLSADSLAKKMKESMADFVEGGGGHVRAGAIRAKSGFVKDVVNQLVRELEKPAP